MPGDQHLWWQRGVIYQIYPRSFRDASGDGVGDLAGVVEKLDYLSSTLGVDALWLSPYYPSPMADFGYDVSDYTDVDPLFGDLSTFDHLIREAHERSLRVIVDYVPNHSSDQHPWFLASKSSRQNPYRDWYIWSDPKPDGSAPNNWLSVFGGPAWEWDETSRQYYLHTFVKEQPDLNWRNPSVRRAMYDVLRFWLQRGVDGFRMDAFRFVMKDALLRDNPLNDGPDGGYHKPRGEYDRQLHVYDMKQPDLHDFLREVRQVLDEYSTPEQPRVVIGEAHIYDPAELCEYYGPALDELHLPFNFGLLATPWQATAIRLAVDSYEAALPPDAWPNYVLGNHDEPRIASRVGIAHAPLAMMLLLTLRGTPTIYYGDELGLLDVPIPPERVRDPWGLNVPGLGLGRDPQRTPMQWDSSPTAGFCSADVEPWLPLSPHSPTVNVALQLTDPHSLLMLTTRLLALRRDRRALSIGDYRSVQDDLAPVDCFVFDRAAAPQRLRVILNFADQPRELPFPPGSRILLSTYLDRAGPIDDPLLTLRPAEGLVLAVD